VRRVPGVVDAALATQLPMAGNIDRYGVAVQDKPLENPELAPSGDRYVVSGDFLRVMRIPVLRGRGFTAADMADTNANVVVVSEALAKRIWGAEDPIGKYIRLGGPTRAWRQVIGVAGNIRHTGLDETVSLQFYAPERQWFGAENGMTLVVRTSGDPVAAIAAIREAVRSVDPLQPISSIATMDDVLSRSTSQRRLGLLLFVAFGLIALLLASAGIYGLLAGAVAERSRELGLRSALGATPSEIVGLVVRQCARLAGIGLLLGGIAAMLLTRYLQAMLFGVGATDPVAIAGGVLAIVVVATIACVVPARRALRVDPMTALRAD
jgi:putative ABC transport system permease protein